MATEVLDWLLEPVPSPLVEAGPRICVVAMDDYRHGVLNGRWLELRAPTCRLRQQLEHLAHTARSGGPLGIFDYEDFPGGITSPTSINELRLRCQE